MSDPPALIASKLDGSPHSARRNSLEPISIEIEECDSDNITISTPTGSIEIVPSQKSVSSTSIGRQRNDFLDIVRIEESNQENDISTMRFPIQATPSTPSKKELIKSSNSSTNSIGSPLANSSNLSPPPENEPGTFATSPQLHLPLPPGGQTSIGTPNSHSSKRTQSTGGSTPGASVSSKNVATKVQKFSSLKKRKQQGPNTLLNRLFCNSPNIISSNNSLIEDEENHEPIRGSTPSVNSGSNGSDDTNPQTRTPTRNGTPKAGNTARINSTIGDLSSCVSISVNVLEQASESLTLYDEAKLRSNIQSNIQDSMDYVCTSNATATSPPTTFSSNIGKVVSFSHHNAVNDMKTGTKSHFGGCDDSTTSVPAISVKIVGDAAVGSTQHVSPLSKANKKSVVIRDEDTDITEPVTKLSNEYGDELAETLSQPFVGSSETPYMISVAKARSSEEGMKTPSGKKLPKSATTKPMKTPGGLVIPSPFTFNGKGIFPSTLGSTSSSLPKAEAKSPLRKSSPRKNSKHQLPIPVLYLPETITLSVTASSSSTVQSFNEKAHLSKDSSPDRIEHQRDLTTSSEVIRLTSSLEDLSTVPEVSTSKEIDDDKTASNQKYIADEIDDDAFLPNQNNSLTTVNKKDTDEKVIDLVSSSSSDQQPLKSIVAHVKSNVKNPASDELVAQYERKINEQKDQIALSNRVAKMRLDEIERLESLMDATNERQSNADELNRMKDRLQQQFQLEKKKEIERACKEMESRLLSQSRSLMDEKMKALSDLHMMEQELTQIKKQLSEAISQPSDDNPNVATLRQELEDVRAKLLVKERENEITLRELDASKKELVTRSFDDRNGETRSTSPPDSEDLNLREELAKSMEKLNDVNEKLRQKEQELQAMHQKQLATDSPSRLNAIPNSRFTSPRMTPIRSGSKEQQRPLPSGDRTSSKKKQHEELKAIYQREKETLRQQILLLEAQAVEANLQHERALAELRQISELEIERVKKEMESRLEYHRETERDLKEALSDASTVEKEELLEQIEILQAEKKLDRMSGLRDVQKKEELLDRIETLEKKEKELIEYHERTINELRTRSDAEIDKLRDEIKSQKSIYLERERELELSITKSHSFEKESLVQKIENLESLLESERNGSVLLKIKVTNFEKDLEAVELLHRDTLQAQKLASDSEIEKLKKELDDWCALEEAMQITTNERDSLHEELQKLKVSYDIETSQLIHKIEELKKCQTHDVLLDQKCKELQCKIDNQSAEMLAMEQKYKVLLTESNSQFESYQSDTESKISALHEELRTSKQSLVEQQLVKQSSDADDLRVRKFEEELQALQALHESQLKTAEESHNKQFEDLLAQLDLVEAEHIAATAAKDKALSEKEAIVGALGSQLAEAQRKIMEACTNRNAEVHAADELRKTCQDLERQTHILKNEVRELKEAQIIFAKEAALSKEKACEEAREEMIEKAEIQFQQANEHYIKLRKQYDESQERAKKFESELKQLKKKIEKIVKDKESNEIDLRAEIAQMQAAKAKIEAESALKAKEYRRELERLLQTAKDFEVKADEACTTSRSIQTTLATVVAEKQKLQQEYEEMKSVSEELMAIVEGGERHEC